MSPAFSTYFIEYWRNDFTFLTNVERHVFDNGLV